jgi:hypothetical protein
MRISRPSPALLVSIIALVVACAGTATAASVVLIKNSSQVKAGALSGTDLARHSLKNDQLANSAVDGRTIKSGSIESSDLSSGVRSALSSAGTSADFVATEAVRKDGPSSPAGQMNVASIKALAPGTYMIIANTTMAPTAANAGLLPELLKEPKNGEGHCRLDAAGDLHDAYAPIASPYALYANTMSLQITRTLAQPSDITLICESGIGWKTANTSIVALKLAGSTRQDTTG